MKKLMCKWVGHRYDEVDMLILRLKCSAENIDELDLSITCLRCGDILNLKELARKDKRYVN